MTWRNLSDERYHLDWQHEFALGARAIGMKSAIAAQQLISRHRAMHRLLRGGRGATSQEWRKVYRKPGWRNIPERWLIDRSQKRMDRALERGLDTAAMERRGLFDPLKSHQKYRGTAKQTKRFQQSWRR